MRSCFTSISSMAPKLPCSSASAIPSLVPRAVHSLPGGSLPADHNSCSPPVFPEFLELKTLVVAEAEQKQQVPLPECSVQGGGGGEEAEEEAKGSSYGACDLDTVRLEEGDGGGGGGEGSGDVSEEVGGGKVWRKRWRGEGETSTRRSERSEKRKERARAYEERWNQRWEAASRERQWGGWQQTTTSQQLGGWVYPEQSGAFETKGSSARLGRQEGNLGGWEQRSESTELGGWLYPDSKFYESFWQRRGDGEIEIEIEVLGKKVLVTIAASAAAVENWLKEHGGESKYGLDIEWRPTFQRGDYHAAALLQLSLEKFCLLIQLRFIEVLPASLQRLLADPNIMLGGVSIKADTNKLKKDHGLVCAGEIELTTLAVLKLKVEALKKAGISSLTETVLGFPHKKDKKATMSNWETRELTLQQIQYAAADAWLSYTILLTLLSIQEQPTIHQVSMPVNTSDTQPPTAVVPQASTVPVPEVTQTNLLRDSNVQASEEGACERRSRS